MSTKPFVYQDSFPLTHNDTEYYLFSKRYVFVAEFDGQPVLKVESQALALLAQQAFHDTAFMLCVSHQQQIASTLLDPEANEDDKYVTLQFLRNPEIAAKGTLSICQNTGTIIIMGKRGQHVWTGGGDEAILAQGAYSACIEDNLRCPQSVPLDMYKEVNIGTDLPTQIGLHSVDGKERKFPCVAKGGGSTNKTCLYQETKALITPAGLKNYLAERIRTLGTAACPPYHIASAIGGTSAGATLKIVKLASIHYYDGLPTEDNEHGQAFRDVQPEQELLQETQSLDLGVRPGGKYFAHDTRVIRLPRHGASCPISMGVSCPADRNIKTRISRDGIWIEKLKSNPGRYIPEHLRRQGEGNVVSINLNQPMSEILTQPSMHPVFAHLSFNGTIIVTRDIAHTKLKELIDNSGALPQYVKDYPIYYAGPAKTPAGCASGLLGPTITGRMDLYVDLLQSHGANMVILAKGSRSRQAIDACHKHGSFYLDSIDGPTVVLAQQSIKSFECVAYPELGMEAIWKIEAEDFSVFTLVDDKGNNFFQQIQNKQYADC